ncbi:hypothetical protein CPT03_07150 [Pedobacter ginsengisoli]|uniref:Methylamine utilisation protein MauE domain-containing protein n=1 Tax=Pedobacter ginsengisoli TaxID=363852 RepID=A0A2D1U3T4_9SPHI|nr:MauE/DoxX family redox-associated membrane protein [Pedobacter ginsengisoli]ATP56262.1 hypothetical protein CPT03_07150 [Pedobacter ginsengisoli]
MILIKWKVLLIEIVSVAFLFLFVYAAFSKLSDIEKFRVQLGKSPILNAFVGIVVYIVPMVEILLAVMLCFKRSRLIAIYGAYTLMLCFSIYIIYILKYSPYIPCSCGGILENMSWRQHLVFNIGFVFVSIVGILMYPTNKEFIDVLSIKGEAENFKE